MLAHGGASVRLYNVLNPKFGMRGLNWLNKNWPEERLRRELPGYGIETSREWHAIISKRAVKRHNAEVSHTAGRKPQTEGMK